MDQITNLALSQLEFYAERASYFSSLGEADLAKFFQQQGVDLVEALEDESSSNSVFFLTDYRVLSSDNGDTFLSDHNDPELR